MDPIQRLMTVDELASYLSVPKGTIYKWRMDGGGPPAHRVGKHLRFDFDDVCGWLRSSPDRRN